MHDVVFAVGKNSDEILQKIKQKWIGLSVFFFISSIISSILILVEV
jgi:hypothetical protein